MAGEKTEKATPKKRREQRKEGNVATSKDVVGVASILGIFYCLQALFPGIYRALRENMQHFFSSVASVDELSMGTLREIGLYNVKVAAECILPIAFIGAGIAIIATGIQTRFLFSGKAASFKISNLSILKGIKNLFSMKNVVEILKSILKIILLSVILYQILKGEMVAVARMTDISPMVASVYTLSRVMSMVLRVGLVFAAIAGFDFFYQRWSYEKKIKMSKEEVKEEFKETEGNPEIKGKIKSLQRSMAQNRMMQAVPDADVIIRNPTHYAVALRYDIDHDNAPVVIAKGQDLIALKIVEIGELNKVTVIENKPLARGIYASTPLGGQIPAEYYGVVAEILVEVFRMNKKLE